MRKVATGIFLSFLVFSCGSKERKTESFDAQTRMDDSVAIVGEQGDEALLDSMATAVPAIRGDENFGDFIFNFASNRKLQMQRIVFPLPYYQEDVPSKIERRDWKMDSLFFSQPFYTLLLDDEEELDLLGEEQGNSVQVDWIYLDTRTMKKYYFERIKGKWMLEAINLHGLQEPDERDFIAFYTKFSRDSIYQYAHVQEPLTFVTSDPDDDFSVIEATIDVNQWMAFKPTLPTDKLSNINYGQKNDSKSTHKIIQLKGFGNGFLNTLYFHWRHHKWELYKFEDTSN